MALNPSTAASSILSAYNTYAALDNEGKPTGEPSSGDFAAAFASALHSFISAGEVPGAVSGGGNPTVIENMMRSIQSSPDTVTAFAQAMADYFSTVAVTPGTPAHGGVSVVSVTNNAASKAPAFATAINESYTTTKTDPGFLNMVENLQAAIGEIEWVVTEQMSNGSTVPFTEVMS